MPVSSPRTMTTEFTYTTTVPKAPAGAQRIAVWVPVPSDGPFQRVHSLRVSAAGAYRLTREPKFGNRMAYVQLSAAAAARGGVTVRFVVERSEPCVLGPDARTPVTPANAPSGLPAAAQLTLPDRNVPTGGRFAAIAGAILGMEPAGSPEKTMRALFDNVVATLRYDYHKESPKLGQGDAAFVCDYKKGNCSDIHSYLIALARTRGIPAYLEFGFPVTGVPVASPLPAEGSVSGYHCWTWFYDGGKGWAPVDAADARRWRDAGRAEVESRLFGGLVLERSAVAISRGRDLTLSPAQRGAPLNYFIYPYAEADGVPIDAAWSVRYRILRAPSPAFPAGAASRLTAAGRGGAARTASSR